MHVRQIRDAFPKGRKQLAAQLLHARRKARIRRILRMKLLHAARCCEGPFDGYTLQVANQIEITFSARCTVPWPTNPFSCVAGKMFVYSTQVKVEHLGAIYGVITAYVMEGDIEEQLPISNEPRKLLSVTILSGVHTNLPRLSMLALKLSSCPRQGHGHGC